MIEEFEKQQLRIMVDLISSMKLQISQMESIIKELRLKNLQNKKELNTQ